MNPKDPQAELREAVVDILRPLVGGGLKADEFLFPDQVSEVDQILALFQAHQLELLSEVLSHENAITIHGTDNKPELIRFVPVSVIKSKIGELNVS